MRKSGAVRKAERKFRQDVPNLGKHDSRPLGKAHFSTVSKTVKQVLGMNDPVLFTDSPIGYAKLSGVRDLGPKNIRHKSSGGAKLVRGSGTAYFTKNDTCYVYVDRQVVFLPGLRVFKIETERDATDYRNSVIAHEVGQVLYNKSKIKKGKQQNDNIGEVIGRFFELDYLFRKNPKLAEQIIERNRKESRTKPNTPHGAASGFANRLFERVKNQRQRRALIRTIATGNFETVKDIEKLIP